MSTKIKPLAEGTLKLKADVRADEPINRGKRRSFDRWFDGMHKTAKSPGSALLDYADSIRRRNDGLDYMSEFVRKNVLLLEASVRALGKERDSLAAELRAARAEIERLQKFAPQTPDGIVPETLEKVVGARDRLLAAGKKAPRKAIAAEAGLAPSTVQRYLDYLKKTDR